MYLDIKDNIKNSTAYSFVFLIKTKNTINLSIILKKFLFIYLVIFPRDGTT